MSGEIIIRVQSSSLGMKRIKSSPSDSIDSLLSRVAEEFKTEVSSMQLWQDRNKSSWIKPEEGRTASDLGIKHGDILFLEVEAAEAVDAVAATSQKPMENIVEDEVDKILGKMDGRIQRERDNKLCQHGANSRCLHCVPLEPYDPAYLAKANPPVKFLSFHSYLRKTSSGPSGGKFAALENVKCSGKMDCRDHLPWPEGICSKCQPKPMTLQGQKYRHVDFIQFENSEIAEVFLNFWRKSGCQRIGFLYGRYEQHKDVPLGIKAVVSVIYEPKQMSTKNSVELIDDEQNAEVDALAAKLGLRRVGWIFTDLVPLDRSIGTVMHHRGNADTYFLSAEECIMAADFQNQFPNACRSSADGTFGSKFVTVAVTGDSANQVHFEGYQVSNQCMALAREDLLLPTVDNPELAYVVESSKSRPVPEVFYAEKNAYSLEVTRSARPFPVEFLIQDMAVAFPKEHVSSLHGDSSITSFPLANREAIGEVQSIRQLCKYMKKFENYGYMRTFRNFHFLVFLASCDSLPLKGAMDDLLEGIRTGDDQRVFDWTRGEAWTAVEEVMEDHIRPREVATERWICIYCTFINSSDDGSCSMCALPRS